MPVQLQLQLGVAVDFPHCAQVGLLHRLPLLLMFVNSFSSKISLFFVSSGKGIAAYWAPQMAKYFNGHSPNIFANSQADALMGGNVPNFTMSELESGWEARKWVGNLAGLLQSINPFALFAAADGGSLRCLRCIQCLQCSQCIQCSSHSLQWGKDKSWCTVVIFKMSIFHSVTPSFSTEPHCNGWCDGPPKEDAQCDMMWRDGVSQWVSHGPTRSLQ